MSQNLKLDIYELSLSKYAQQARARLQWARGPFHTVGALLAVLEEGPILTGSPPDGVRGLGPVRFAALLDELVEAGFDIPDNCAGWLRDWKESAEQALYEAMTTLRRIGQHDKELLEALLDFILLVWKVLGSYPDESMQMQALIRGVAIRDLTPRLLPRWQLESDDDLVPVSCP